MVWGAGLRYRAIAGGVLTVIGLLVVAIWPPTALPPVGFLGTLALGGGLAILTVATFEVVVASRTAPDSRSSDERHSAARSDNDFGGRGLASSEDFLRGGGGIEYDDSGAEQPEAADSDATPEIDTDEDAFIWGEDRAADDDQS